jgi:putative peptidoglycan lipid II flippase
VSSPAPNVARAGGIMMISLLLSRVLGLVRDSVMSGMFGSDIYTDAYTVSFMIPDLLFFLLAGGALSSAFIPVFSEYLHTDRQDDAWKVFSVVVSVMTLALVVLIAAAWIFAEPLSRAIAPGEKMAEVIPLIAHMGRILLPAQLAFFLGGLMFGTLYARQVFTVPGLGPNIYNLGIIFGAVVLSGLFSPGVIGMSWGALAGAVVGNLVLPYFAMRRLESRFRFSLDLSHPGVKKVFKLMLPVVLGLSLPGVYALILQWFGSFYPEGVNTALKYSNQLMLAPVGVFGQSLAIAVFPALSQFYAQGEMGAFRKQLAGTMRTVIYVTLPISAIMIALSPQIVAAVYQHGKFTSGDTAMVAGLLSLFGIGIFAWCLHPVLMRAFFALHNSILPIALGTATTALFLGLVAAAWYGGLQYTSLPLASSICAVALVIALAIAIRAKIGPFGLGGIALTAVKAAIASAAVAVPLWLLTSAIAEQPVFQGKIGPIVLLLLAGSVAGWAYYAITKALKMPETEYVRRALRRLEKKPGSAAQQEDAVERDVET